jgi:hypothetical protein
MNGTNKAFLYGFLTGSIGMAFFFFMFLLVLVD